MRGKAFPVVTYVALILILTVPSSGFANFTQKKYYKAAYPGMSAKCNTCHSLRFPLPFYHPWNDYGQKARDIKKTPDVETYHQIGAAPVKHYATNVL